MTLTNNDGQTVQDHHKWVWRPLLYDFTVGTEIGLNSKYSMGKREFIAQEQGRGQWMENYSQELSQERGILSKPIQQPTRFFA